MSAIQGGGKSGGRGKGKKKPIQLNAESKTCFLSEGVE